MFTHLRPAATLLALFTLLLGIAYPLAMTGAATSLLPRQASGSLVTRDGQTVGSQLIGQSFSQDRYLHPRPSAAGDGYDASASSGTNLAPTSATLAERLETDSAAMREATGASTLPADAITTSGSGLDPHVSPAYAALQAPRIAEARGLTADEIERTIAAFTSGRTLGILGEPRVNVLAVNLALDAIAPAAPENSAPGGTPTASAQ